MWANLTFSIFYNKYHRARRISKYLSTAVLSSIALSGFLSAIIPRISFANFDCSTLGHFNGNDCNNKAFFQDGGGIGSIRGSWMWKVAYIELDSNSAIAESEILVHLRGVTKSWGLFKDNYNWDGKDETLSFSKNEITLIQPQDPANPSKYIVTIDSCGANAKSDTCVVAVQNKFIDGQFINPNIFFESEGYPIVSCKVQQCYCAIGKRNTGGKGWFDTNKYTIEFLGCLNAPPFPPPPIFNNVIIAPPDAYIPIVPGSKIKNKSDWKNWFDKYGKSSFSSPSIGIKNVGSNGASKTSIYFPIDLDNHNECIGNDDNYYCSTCKKIDQDCYCSVFRSSDPRNLSLYKAIEYGSSCKFQNPLSPDDHFRRAAVVPRPSIADSSINSNFAIAAILPIERLLSLEVLSEDKITEKKGYPGIYPIAIKINDSMAKDSILIGWDIDGSEIRFEEVSGNYIILTKDVIKKPICDLSKSILTKIGVIKDEDEKLCKLNSAISLERLPITVSNQVSDEDAVGAKTGILRERFIAIKKKDEMQFYEYDQDIGRSAEYGVGVAAEYITLLYNDLSDGKKDIDAKLLAKRPSSKCRTCITYEEPHSIEEEQRMKWTYRPFGINYTKKAIPAVRHRDYCLYNIKGCGSKIETCAEEGDECSGMICKDQIDATNNTFGCPGALYEPYYSDEEQGFSMIHIDDNTINNYKSYLSESINLVCVRADGWDFVSGSQSDSLQYGVNRKVAPSLMCSHTSDRCPAYSESFDNMGKNILWDEETMRGEVGYGTCTQESKLEPRIEINVNEDLKNTKNNVYDIIKNKLENLKIEKSKNDKIGEPARVNISKTEIDDMLKSINGIEGLKYNELFKCTLARPEGICTGIVYTKIIDNCYKINKDDFKCQ